MPKYIRAQRCLFIHISTPCDFSGERVGLARSLAGPHDPFLNSSLLTDELLRAWIQPTEEACSLQSRLAWLTPSFFMYSATSRLFLRIGGLQANPFQTGFQRGSSYCPGPGSELHNSWRFQPLPLQTDILTGSFGDLRRGCPYMKGKMRGSCGGPDK